MVHPVADSGPSSEALQAPIGPSAAVTFVAFLTVAAGAWFGVGSLTTVFGCSLLCLLVAATWNERTVLGMTAGVSLVNLLVFGTVNVPRWILVVASICAVISVVVAVGRVRRRSIDLSFTSRITYYGSFSLLALILLASLNYAAAVLAVTGAAALLIGSRFSGPDLRAFSRIVVVFALLQVLEAALELIGVRFAPWSSYSRTTLVDTNFVLEGTTRAEGLLGHPIPLSMLFTVAVVILWVPPVAFRRLFAVFLTPVLLAGILATGTRSAFVAVAVALVLGVLAPRLSFGARLVSLVMIVVAAAAVLASSTLGSYVTRASAVLVRSGSYTHRRGAFESIPGVLDSRLGLDYWFGGGFGDELQLFDEGLLQSDNFHIVDNQFVSTLVWVGLVGFALLIIIFCAVLVSACPLASILAGVLVVYFNSFDLLRWQGGVFLTFTVFGLAAAHDLRMWTFYAKRFRGSSRQNAVRGDNATSLLAELN